LTYPRAKVDMLKHIQRVFLSKEEAKNKIWGFAGQIKSFNGPFVVLACFGVFIVL